MTKKQKETSEENDKTPKKSPQRNAKGQFVKGKEKTGGRAPGTKNKYGNIRDRLKEIILPYLDTEPTDRKTPSLLSDLVRIDDPKDRADVISKFLPFVVPKFSSTTISADTDRPIDEEQQLTSLDKQYSEKELTLTLKQVTIVDNDAPSAASSRRPLTDYDPDEDDDFDVSSLK